MTNQPRRVAFYARVSSEEQRERASILTQVDELERRLRETPDATLVDTYLDDGISGTVPMAKRSAGGRMLAAARAGHFTEVWVFKLDRIGRDDVDPLLVRQQLTQLGIKLIALHDNIEGSLEYALRVAIAAEERRAIRARSFAGMARAARAGRYQGGPVPFGYTLTGKKPDIYLMPSDRVMVGTLTEADIVRRMYSRLADDGWTCCQIASELNALGVPTTYQRDGRTVQGQNTVGCWRAGRVRNLIANTLYKGEYRYGKKASQATNGEVISATVPALVEADTWNAAQRQLAQNRMIASGPGHSYLLRRVLRCGVCGLGYSGSISHGRVVYRCNGRVVDLGPLRGHCPSRYIQGEPIERQILADVERFLYDPGALLDELSEESVPDERRAVAEAEALTFEAVLKDLDQQRQRVLQLSIKGILSDEELDAELERIASQRKEAERRLAVLRPYCEEIEEPVPVDLLSRIRERLQEGLTFDEQQQIVRLLVKQAVVHTDLSHPKRPVRVDVEYRFPGGELVRTDVRA